MKHNLQEVVLWDGMATIWPARWKKLLNGNRRRRMHEQIEARPQSRSALAAQNLNRSGIMTQLAAATNPAHRTMLESALKSINDEMAQ